MLTKNVGILGVGSCLPEKVLTNFDLEKMVDTSDEWITKRTGIHERRVLDDKTPLYKLAASAAKNALENSGTDPMEIDLIITATVSPDFNTPTMSSIIQGEIGAKNAAAFDINAACSGFIYALTVAQQFVKTGIYKKILVLGSEALSRVTDWEDRNSCILFADGAGAIVIGEVEAEYGFLSNYLGADAESKDVITIPGFYYCEKEVERRGNIKGQTIRIDGSEVFKFAVKVLEQATIKVLNDVNMKVEDIDLLIPHQANIRIIEGASKRLGISKEKMFTNIHKYGNMSSASIPVALDEAYRSGLISKGDNIVLCGFGGGLTWGSTIMKWAY